METSRARYLRRFVLPFLFTGKRLSEIVFELIRGSLVTRNSRRFCVRGFSSIGRRPRHNLTGAAALPEQHTQNWLSGALVLHGHECLTSK